MPPGLLVLMIEQLPHVIEQLKALFMKRNPNVPEPTSEQVIAAFNAGFYASLAKDDAWLEAHPEGGGNSPR